MTEQAQNALLKTIEEPPVYAIDVYKRQQFSVSTLTLSRLTVVP